MVAVQSLRQGPDFQKPARALAAGIAILTGLLIGQTLSSVFTEQPTPKRATVTGQPAAPATVKIQDAENGEVKIQFPPGTPQLAAEAAVASLDLTLASGDPATGLFYFRLPQIQAEMVSDTTALVYFPSIAQASDIAKYLSDNGLTLLRRIRDRVDSDGLIVMLVRVPVKTVMPTLIDPATGIFEFTLATGLDRARVLAWATQSGFMLLSYDPITGKARVKIRPIAPVRIPPVVQRTVPQPPRPDSTPIAASPGTTELFVRASVSDPTSIAAKVGITLTSVGSDGLMVASVPSSRAAGTLQLLSDLSDVQCVADTQNACTAISSPAAPPPDTVLSSVSAPAYSAPVGLVVVAASDGAQLNWGPASGATAYLIERQVGGSTVTVGRVLAGASNLTFTDRSEPDGSASYRVSALHGCANSAVKPGCDTLAAIPDPALATPFTAVTRVMPVDATAPPIAASSLLPAPVQLIATATDGHVQLAWQNVAGATSYRVYRGASQAQLAYDAATTDTQLSDIGGSAGQPSVYAVAAVASDGIEGAASTVATATWTAATSQPIIERTLPANADHLSGSVRLQVEVKSGDGTGHVEWHLSGPRAAVELGSATGYTSKFDPLAWTAVRNWDSRSVPDGTYTLRIVAYDGAGNQNEISQTFRIQNGAPSAPGSLAVATQASTVTLSWQQAPTAGAAMYRIYRDSPNLGAPLAEIPIDARTFQDRDVSIGSHHYQLVLVDRTGQASVVSAADAVIAGTSTTNPGQPVLTMRALLPSGEALAADGRVTDRLLLISSQLPDNATNGRFELSGDGLTWTAIEGTTCTERCTLDWQLASMPPGPYLVRAAATVGGAAVTSDYRSFILQKPVPIPAPMSPAALVTPEGVSLSWTLPDGVFPAAVAVFRQQAGAWQLLAAVSGRNSYLDEDAPVGSAVTYRVQPVDRDGTPGTPSIEASALAAAVTEAQQVTAPSLGAPQGMRIVVSAGRVALIWNPVPGADGYVVRRAMGTDGAPQVVARTAGVTTFVDRAGPIGGQVMYRVSALSGASEGPQSDAIGALLIPAPATAAVPAGAPQESIPGTPMPAAPSNLVSNTTDGSVELTWSASSAPAEPVSYNVYRLDPDVGSFVLAQAGLTTPTFTDSGLGAGRTFGYVVTATGADGREGAFSSPVWVTSPSYPHSRLTLVTPAPPASALLTNNPSNLIARAGAGLTGITFAVGPPGGPWKQIPGALPLNLPADPSSSIAAGATDWSVNWDSASLPPGTYELRLSAVDESGQTVEQRQSILIGGAGARAPPSAAQDVKVTPLANGVHLEWTSGDGAPFEVLRSIFGTAGPFEPIGQSATGSFEDRNLVPGFGYQYQVTRQGRSTAVLTSGPAAPAIDPEAGASSADGKFKVQVPSASASSLALVVNPMSSPAPLPSGFTLIGSVYSVDATSLASQVSVHRLDELATLQLPLDTGTTQALATSMRILHWDDLTASWMIEGGAPDAGLTALTVTTTHFSAFALASITAQSSAGPTPQPPVAPTDNGNPAQNTTSAINPIALPKLDIAPDGEVLNLRDANSTTYQNPDGSFRKVISAGPVHYQDSSGQWQNIDTTLVADSGGGYRNAAGSVSVHLPNRLSDGPISLSRGPVSVQMALEGAGGRAMSAIGDRGQYAGVVSGIDAEYTMLAEGIKESLVLLAEPTAPLFISFRLDTGNLVLTLAPNGSIHGSLGGIDVEIPAPFMAEHLGPDLLGASSSAVAVSMAGANGHYRITYTPDASWLSNPARKYPVVIDPSMTFQHQVANDGLDVMVSSWNGNTNYYGGTSYEDVGYDPSVGMTRTYLNFWPMMCDGCWASSATLYMYQYTNYNYQRGNAMRTYYARPSGSFNAGSITWNNQPFGSAPVVGAQTLTSPGWMAWNVLPIIQDFENHSIAVNGFVVNDSTETTAYNTSELFRSFVYSSIGYHPELVINYDTYQYYVLSASFASTGSWVPSGGSTTANVVLQNLGTATWTNNIRLSYQWLQNGTALSGALTARVYLPYSVATNQIVQLSFTLNAPPASSGNIQLQFALVNEYVFWFQSLSWCCPTYSNVTSYNNGASVPIAPESYTMTGVNLPATLEVQAGSLVTIPVTVKNTDTTTLDNTTWQAFNYNDLMRIGIRSYRRLDGSPAGTMAMRTSLPQDLGPGQSATVNTVFQAPGDPGDYVFRLDTVHEHLTPAPAPKDGVINGMTGGVTSPLGNTPGTGMWFGSPIYVKATNWLPSQTGWSIEAWIYPTGPQLSLAVYNGDNNGGYGFGIGNGSGASGSKLQGLFGNVAWIDSGYTFPAWNQWYHVVMTNDGSTTRFYVNGAQTSGTSSAVPKPLLAYGTIGAVLSGGAPNSYFAGNISDVATYAGPLSASRIMSHFKAANAATTPNAYQSAIAADSPVTYYRLNDGGGSVARDSSGPIWGEDRGNQPLEVRVRVLAPGEDKSAHTPIPLDDGSSLAVNTSNGFATLDASDLSIQERGNASLHIDRTYNGVNGAVAANGTSSSNATYGVGWTFDFQRSLHLGSLGPQTRGLQTGFLTDAQGRSWQLTWNAGRGLFEDAAGNRTVAGSTATVVTPNNANGLTVPGVMPIDQVGNPAILTSPPAGSPRGVALAMGSNPTALVFPQGMVPAQQDGTIEFWFYPNFNMGSSTTAKQVFLSDTTGHFGLAWNDGTGTATTQAFDFFTYDADVGSFDRLYSAAVTTNAWHHVVITWQENGPKQIYIDQLPSPASNSATVGQSPIGEVFLGYNPAWTSGTTAANAFPLNADIAELRIEGAAISAQQASADGAAGAQAPIDGSTLYLGAFTAPAGISSIAGTYILTNADQSQEIYTPWGQLKQERDRHGNAIDYSWDSLGRITRISDDALASRAINFYYGTPPNGSNCQATGSVFVIDPGSRCITYVINSSGDLVSVTRSNQVPDPLTGVVSSKPATTQYGYSPVHVLQQITDPMNGVTTVTPETTYRRNVMANSPVAYYQLDETSGTLAADSSGIGHNGTIVGGVTGVSGAMGVSSVSGDTSMQFDGTTGYISLSSSLDTVFQNHDFSVEVWAYFSDSSTTIDRAILGAGPSTYATDQWLHLVRRNNKAYMGFYSDDMSGNTVMSANRWWHIVFTWVASTRQRTIYVNGAIDAQGTSSGALNIPSGSPVMIGHTWSNGFDYGSLDEVAIYNVALSQAQVQAHFAAASGAATASGYKQTVLRDAPLAYYPLDEPGGSSVVHDAGTPAATPMRGVTSAVAGVFAADPAMQFDGVSSYVLVPPTAIGPWLTGPISIELWFKTRTSGVILGQDVGGPPGGGSVSGYVPALYIDTNGALRAEVFWHNASTPLTATGPYTDGAWHHVVDTVAGGTETLYVDGVARTSQAVTETAYGGPYTYMLGTGYASNWPNAPSGVQWWYFNGSIDEFATYGSALPAARVSAHYGSSSITSYRQTVQADAPIAYYPLDDASLQSVTNTANGASATLIGGVTMGVPGGMTNETAAQLDGATGYLQSSSSWTGSATGWTLEAWIKPAAAQNALAVYNGTDAGGYGFGVSNGAGTGTGLVLTGLFGGIAWFSSGYTMTANTWYDVAMTNDGTTTRFYVNGTATSGTYTANQPRIPATTATVGTEINSVSNRDFNGSIDEVGIFNGALAANRIQAHYNANASVSNYRAAVQLDSPVGYYPLDESLQQATNIGAGNVGSLVGGVTAAGAGALTTTSDAALQFDGSTGEVDTRYVQSGVTAYSVEAWVRTTNAGTNRAIVEDRGGVLNSGPGKSLTLGLNCYCNSGWAGGGTPFFVAESDGVEWGLWSGTAINDGNWHHLVGTWSAPSGTAVAASQFALYVDGAPAANLHTFSTGTAPTSPLSGLGATKIAAHDAWGNHLSGSIEEVALYTSVLSSARVQAHYSSASSPASYQQAVAADSPAAFYPLNEPGLGTAHDISSVGAAASIYGGVTVRGPPLVPSAGYSMAFDGATGYVSAPSLGALQGDNSRTVEFWLKTTATNQQVIFDSGTTGSNFQAFEIGLTQQGGVASNPAPGQNTPGIYVTTWGNDIYMPNENLADGNPHYLAVTLAGAAVSIVVDGATPSAYVWSGSSWVLQNQPLSMYYTPNSATNPMWIGRGRQALWGLGSSWFTGSLDEVAIYNSGLTVAQLVAHYYAARDMTPPLNDRPLAYYRLNEASGSTAYDSSGNAINGAIGSAVTPGAQGAIPNSSSTGMQFNGLAGSTITLTLPSSITSATNLTVDFWAYHTGGNAIMPFGFNMYDLYHYNNAFGFNTGSSDLWGVADSTSGFSPFVWHHVVAVFNNGNPQLNKLWIDGVAQPLTQIMGTTSTSGHTLSTTAQISGWPTNPQYFWNGGIAEVAIYATALYASQVQGQYNGVLSMVPRRIGSITDANGNVTKFVYNDVAATTQVINPLGQSTYYTFQQYGGRTLSTVDSGNNVTTYTWDSSAAYRLTGTVSPTGIRESQLVNGTAPVGQQEQVLIQDTAAQPADNKFDFVNGSFPATGQPFNTSEPSIWDASVEFQPGRLTHVSTPTIGTHQHGFQNAVPMAIPSGATATQWAYLEPGQTPPTELMIQFESSDVSWEHRAYWGMDFAGWGVDGSPSRRPMGGLPPAGRWVALTVPMGPTEWGQSDVDMANRSLIGVAWTTYGGTGRVWWGPLSFTFPAANVADPQRTITRYAYDAQNDTVAAVDPNGIATVTDVDANGLIRQMARGVEPVAPAPVFEDQLSTASLWSFEYGYAPATTSASTVQHSGVGSLQQVQSAIGSESDLYRDAPTYFAAGTYLQVSVWVMTVPNTNIVSGPGSGGASLFIEDDTASRPDGVPSLSERRSAVLQTPSGTWQQLSLPFITDASGKVRIHLVQSNFGGTTIWSDVVVRDITPVSSTTLQHPNALYATDLEQPVASTNWVFQSGTSAGGGFVVNPSFAHSGSTSLKLTVIRNNSNAEWVRTFAVSPNTTYRATAWVKTVTSGSTTATASFGGVRLWLTDNGSPAANVWNNVIRTDGQWQMLTLDITTAANASSLTLQLYDLCFMGDTYWDDVQLQQLDSGGAWSAGWNAKLSGAAATWSLKATSYGIGIVPARDVTVTSTASSNDVQDATATAPLRQGATYVVSLWASASVANSGIDISVQDSSGNRLPTDYPSTCKIAQWPNQTLCQNSLTYTGADATAYQMVLGYGGWGARDVYVSHPVIALSSEVMTYTPYGQVSDVTDIFGHEQATTYDSNGLYPFQHLEKTGSGYKSMVLADAPLSYWRLDEMTGVTAHDSAGTNNGTAQGGVVFFQPGGLFGDNNRALTFDGSTGTVAVNVPTIDTTSGHRVTVEFWMKWNGGSTWQMPFGFNSYDLWLGPSGQFGFNTANGDLYGVSGIPTNTWLHVVAIFTNGTVSANQLYIDGVQQTLSQITGTPIARSVSAGANIAGWPNGGYSFSGTLDEVAVYNGALSATRIQTHYGAGRAQVSAASGAPSLSTQLQYNVLGQLVSSTRISGPQQITDQYQLDSWGRKTAEIRNYVASGPNDAQTNVRTGFAYDLDGQLTDTHEPGGAITHTDYDANGNKTDTIQNYVSSSTTETASQHVKTTYAYDALNRLIYETSPQFTSPASSTTALVYDNGSRVIKHIEGYGVMNATSRTDYDADGRVIATYQPVGTGSTLGEIKSTKTYDVLGRLISQTSAATAGSAVSPAPAQTDYTLDAGGRVTDVVNPGVGASATRTRTHYDYDALGRVLDTVQNCTDLAGVTCGAPSDSQTNVKSRMIYDPRGATTSISAPTQQQPNYGVATRAEVDLVGHPIRQVTNDLVRTDITGTEAAHSPASDIKVTTTTAYDGFGRVSDVTDARGTVTHTDYDALDRAIAVTTDPGTAPHLNSKTSYAYAIPGDLMTSTYPSGRIDLNQYDALHRKTAYVQNYISTAPMNADYQTNLETLWTYDSLGRELTMTDPTGRVTKTDYDLVGRTLATTKNYCTVATSICQPVADWQDNVKTQYQVDAAGLVISETSPLGVVTTYGYDAQGRMVQVVEDAGAGNVNATTTYSYDSEGHQLTTKDPLSNVTTLTLDLLGRVTMSRDPVQAQANTGLQTQYSPAGESITRTIARTNGGTSVVNTFTYDRLARLTTVNYLKADLKTGATLTYGYDAGGLMTSFSQSDSPITTSITYDAMGRVTNVSGQSNTSYTYGPDGAVSTVSDATGPYSFTPDAIGRIKTASDPLTGATTIYARDMAGRVSQRADATGITSNYQYSALDDLTVKTMAIGSTQIASWDMTKGPSTPYDASGHMLSQLVTLPGDPMAAPSSGSGLAVFSYDHLGRLATATQPSIATTKPVLTYTYDAAGNRIQVSGGSAPQGSTSFWYQTNSALGTETPTGGTTINYTPDLDGNIQADAAGRAYHYDSLNRLEWVNDPGTSSTITYVYDALGRLIKRTQTTAGTPVVQFLYRGLEDKVVRELNGSNTVLRSYAWDTSQRRLFVQVSGTVFTIATDPHGDVVGLIDNTGTVRGTAHYDAWGQVMSVTANMAGFPFGYQSGYTDATSSYVRMGKRWYDPREGRFTSEDPSQPNLRNPMSGDLWLYAADDPATWIDPLGLKVMADGGGGDDGSVDSSAVATTPSPKPASSPQQHKKKSQNPVQGFLNWFGSKADAVKHTVINVVRKTQAEVSAVGRAIDDNWQDVERLGEKVGRAARDTAADFGKWLKDNVAANVAGAALGAVDGAKIVMRHVKVVAGTIERGIIRNGSRAVSFVEKEVAYGAKRVVAHVADEVEHNLAMVERETLTAVRRIDVGEFTHVDFAAVTRTTLNLSKIAFRASAVLEVVTDVGGQTIDEFQHAAQRTWQQHVARVVLAAAKAAVIIGAGIAAGALIAAAAVSAPVWVPIVVGIAVGIAIGYGADKLQETIVEDDPKVFGRGA